MAPYGRMWRSPLRRLAFAAPRRAAASAPRRPDYASFIKPVAARRQPSATRALMPLMRMPGMISLGTGVPNPDLFPFKGVQLTLRSGEQLELSDREVREALQYSPTPGLPELVATLKDMQTREHAPPYQDWDLVVTTGSQDGICRAFEMLLTPDDTLVVESPTYSGVLSFLHPLGCRLLPVRVDADGIVVEELERVLRDNSGTRKPTALYTIPTGQNPSGATATAERRRAVYELAAQHDMLILEDDPYRFLYYGRAQAPPTPDGWRIAPLPSYLSMDKDARVLRFDSLSKVLSSGMRLGFVTGPQALVDRIHLHMQATELHASGLSQAAAAKLLKHWGRDGWERHVREVAFFYMRRRDAFEVLARQALPSDLAEWSSPSAGMFVWLQLRGVSDTQQLIRDKAVKEKVLLLPGQAFDALGRPSSFVRAAFSLASDEEIAQGLARLARLVRSEAGQRV